MYLIRYFDGVNGWFRIKRGTNLIQRATLHAGKYNLMVNWHCFSMDNDCAQTRIELSIDINSLHETKHKHKIKNKRYYL